jgi:DNA recombination protein RmuC
MFIPIEGAFQLMQETAPLLWHKAKDEKVLIVSQMSLSVVLNMVLIAWRQHDQQRNIEEVYDTASELMTAISNWMQTYTKLGEAIEKVGGEYRESTRKLTESNQSVVKKIAKLERLRVTPKRSKAAVKSGGRKGLAKPDSIIPPALAPAPDDEEDISEES